MISKNVLKDPKVVWYLGEIARIDIQIKELQLKRNQLQTEMGRVAKNSSYGS